MTLSGRLRALAGTPLVAVAELAAALAGPTPPVVLDVRWPIPGPPDRAGYLAGHVPGARFVDLDADLSGPPAGADGGNHPLPDAAAFTTAMRRHGIRAGYPVVVLDADCGLAAGRAWWTLRYFGHEKVWLLDGGFAAWRAAGLPVAIGKPDEVSEGDFTADPGHLPVIDAAQAAGLARSGVLLDARSAARYAGEDSADRARGHIPGALSAPATGNTDAQGRWLDPDALRARFAAVIAPGAQVGVHCGSGVTACSNLLAFAAAGWAIPALYIGSWSEWTARDGSVVTGSDPG